MAERPPAQRRWSSTNSRQLMKAYGHSAVQSPSKTPPTLSRSNSTTSITSTKSEPAWSSQRRQSEPSLNAGDFNELRHRRESIASQKSAQPTAPPKKFGLKGFFSHEKDPAKEKEKERKRREKDLKYKEQQRIVLGSRYAAAVRTKMLMDPSYKEHLQKHKKPNVKTAGIKGEGLAAHSAAALQEMRYPHSGPPAVHGGRDIPMLTRIESHDEPDTEIDRREQIRREWNDAKEHNMGDIPEIRSRQGSSATSPWTSPMASREPSPNRLGARPGLGSKRNSYAGGYTKDATTGRWTRKTPPSHTPTTPPNGAVNPDLLAASLAERLNAAV